ncbi:MAG: DNA methylase [Lachnospiraceae bacterium]|nr:DNA methylase [Lachnospiraceae bacterium]
MQTERVYLAIDLKSFYASVECMERGLNPLTTNLVVADLSRTEKTICLAVSPSLKAFGIPGRARLFEVIERVREVNIERKRRAHGVQEGSSTDAHAIEKDKTLAVDYITATPRMRLYVNYSTRIYDIYLDYVAPADIHVYSIDEVFMDVTSYLSIHGKSPQALAKDILLRVANETGMTATAGIGTNLYLAKIAMDIGAKKIQSDEDGVRIATFDEISYREALWTHEPLTDFWRIGRGYAKKLAEHGMFTMGDVARCSVGAEGAYHNEELLYRLFGVNAELLIDHAWGYEPCTMEEIKTYVPMSNSLSSGQVLQEPYPFEKARLIVKEMTDLMVLDLVKKHLYTSQITLTIGYDIENLKNGSGYRGEIKNDWYGRAVPKHAHGSHRFDQPTSSTRIILDAVMELYDRIVNPALTVRRITVSAEALVEEKQQAEAESYEQMDLFTDYAKKEEEEERLQREKRLQHAILDIQDRYGKNALVKGMNLEEGATTMERNAQIGGHRA